MLAEKTVKHSEITAIKQNFLIGILRDLVVHLGLQGDILDCALQQQSVAVVRQQQQARLGEQSQQLAWTHGLQVKFSQRRQCRLHKQHTIILNLQNNRPTWAIDVQLAPAMQ